MVCKLDICIRIFELVGRALKHRNISLATIKNCDKLITCVNLPKKGGPKILSRVHERRLIEVAKNKMETPICKLSSLMAVSRTIS